MTSDDFEHGNALSGSLLADVEGNQCRVVAGKEVSLASLKLPMITTFRIFIISSPYISLTSVNPAFKSLSLQWLTA